MKNLFKINLFALLLMATITSCTSCNENQKKQVEDPAPVDTNIGDSTKIDKAIVDSTKIKVDSTAKTK
jgi:hypothetical protein